MRQKLSTTRNDPISPPGAGLARDQKPAIVGAEVERRVDRRPLAQSGTGIRPLPGGSTLPKVVRDDSTPPLG